MSKEEVASRIKDLICKYKEKKDELENHKTDYEKLRKHRNLEIGTAGHRNRLQSW